MRIVDIAGYEGLYAIDELGNVYSYKFGKVKKLKSWISALGYFTVELQKDKCRKVFCIHRLLAKAFFSNYSDDLQVDHIDRDRANNKLDNLRMVTPQENTFNRTGTKGYHWREKRKKWQAYICRDKKWMHLGYFDKEEDARKAYLAAKKIYHVI